MKTRNRIALYGLLPAALLWSLSGQTQVPVDEDGNVIGTHDDSYETYSTEPTTGNEGIPLLSAAELQELVGPVALYPDDLLAVVLPASTYPLQVVQAARFLEDLESNPELKPDPEWDDSIIALVNYPEVVELLNEDLDWTWRLGEAVVAQQSDVVSAVEEFRDRAYAAGNLKSDDYQTVTRDEGIIEITPVNEEVIYVPYYEPERVVYYQPRPVYYYYPRPYPVYYYPYPSNYAFNRGFFWGVTTAFTIGWHSDHLRVFHHSYHGHPYYGVRYWDRWWYRRPNIHVYNNVYVNNSVNTTSRYRRGDYWRPSRTTRLRSSDQRISRSTYRPRRETASGLGSVNRQTNRSTSTTSRRSTDQRRRQVVGQNDRQRVQRQLPTNVQRERQSQHRDQQRTSPRQIVQRQTSARSSNQRRVTERRDTPTSVHNDRQQVQQQRVQRQRVQRQRATPQPAQRRQVQRQTADVVRERRSPPAAQARRQSSSSVERRSQPSQKTQRQAQTTEHRSQKSETKERRASSSRRSYSARENNRRRQN